MSKKWQTGLGIFVLIVAFLLTGGLAYESGYDSGWDEGYEGGVQIVPPGEIVEIAQIPYWYGEPEEPDWERILTNILGEIDTANITIYIEDTEGVKADIHISWSK